MCGDYKIPLKTFIYILYADVSILYFLNFFFLHMQMYVFFLRFYVFGDATIHRDTQLLI